MYFPGPSRPPPRAATGRESIWWRAPQRAHGFYEHVDCGDYFENTTPNAVPPTAIPMKMPLVKYNVDAVSANAMPANPNAYATAAHIITRDAP